VEKVLGPDRIEEIVGVAGTVETPPGGHLAEYLPRRGDVVVEAHHRGAGAGLAATAPAVAPGPDAEEVDDVAHRHAVGLAAENDAPGLGCGWAMATWHGSSFPRPRW